MANGGLHDFLGGVEVDVLVRDVLGLGSLPVVAIGTIEHAADVPERKDPLARGEVVDGLRLNRLLRRVDAFAVIQGDQAPAPVRPYPAEAVLPLLQDAIPR